MFSAFVDENRKITNAKSYGVTIHMRNNSQSPLEREKGLFL